MRHVSNSQEYLHSNCMYKLSPLATLFVNITAGIIPIWDVDIPIIITEYENEEQSICSDKSDQPADVDYTCTNMTFPDNKTLHNELLIHSSNLDSSFPNSIFTIDGFTPPYRKDRTNMDGGIILYYKG